MAGLWRLGFLDWKAGVLELARMVISRLWGGRVLDPKVEVRRLGLAGLQEIVFHGRLRGGAGKGAGRGDMPNVGEWQCSFCMAPHCWHTKLACYKCGTPRYWETGVMGQGNPGGFPGKGGGFVGGVPGQAAGFFGQGNVANAMGGTRIVGPTGRDQAYVSRGEPTYRKGGGSKGGGKGDVDTGAGVGGKFFADGGGGSGGEAVGREVGMGQAPAGPPPSHREQVVSALQALVGLFEPDVGAQVRGLVQGFLPPKPASPAPVTPTHAEIVAKLHKLYDSETQLVRKADEVEGRVEKVRAKLVEEEEAALAKVQRELQGVKDQIMASLRDEQDCRERTRKGGSDSDGMEDAVTVDEGESSEEVVEQGKRRKVRRRGRFSRRGGAFGTTVNLLDVVGILKGLSKEDRGRCMRSAEMNDELSSMSGRNSGRGTAEDSTAVFNAVWVMTTVLGSWVIFLRLSLAQGKFQKFLNPWKMHVKGPSFLRNFEVRSEAGPGQAAAGSSAAFAQLGDQVDMQAAAALVDLGDLVGAGPAAFFQGDLGRASAATDSVFSFNASHDAHAAVFSGDPGRAGAALRVPLF